MVQIESRKGMAAAARIAAVDGVDGVFIGPSDLAAGLGQLGNPNHPDVQAAIREIFATVAATGKPLGTLAPVEADARRYMSLGANFVAVGSDLGLFRMTTQALRDKYRE
jgi:2-dehydro-3-deoxyglucarate aldolase